MAILIKDGVKYQLWKPKNEVNVFEPMVKDHVVDIFGKNSLWFNKIKIPTIPGINRIPDGFVIDFTNKKWYLIELKILCDDAINRIGDQISDDEEIPDNITALRKIAQTINEQIEDEKIKVSVSDIILTYKPKIIVIIDNLNGIPGEQFRKRAKKADKIIEFKTYVRVKNNYSGIIEDIKIHEFEPIYPIEFLPEKKKIEPPTILDYAEKEEIRKEKKEELKTFSEAIIQIISDLGGQASLKDIFKKVPDYWQLTKFQKSIDPRTNQVRWKHSLQGILQTLKKSKIVERVDRGIWKITNYKFKSKNKKDKEFSGRNKYIQLNDKYYEINNSLDILFNTANWLIENNELTNDMIPISTGKKRYLINKKPIHKSGKPFFAAKKLSNGLYIETHASKNILIKHSQMLLKICGLPINTLKLVNI